MSTTSRIEWTEASWNPVTGCTKVSAGCKHCYAESLARRLRAMGVQRYAAGFRVALHPDQVDLPLHWRRPRRIFVNSMSDLFHETIPQPFIDAVFETMRRAHWHSFQVLTKRSTRLRKLAPRLPWPENVWMGVTVEDRKSLSRVDDLRDAPAAVRFLSIEPLLEDIGPVDLTGIDWVIVGGESGTSARPMQPEWVRAVRDQCTSGRIPFFFKQWGGRNKKQAGRALDGRVWDEMPRLGEGAGSANRRSAIGGG